MKTKDSVGMRACEYAPFPISVFRDSSELLEYKARFQEHRIGVERLLCEKHVNNDPAYTWTVSGYSESAKQAVSFIISWSAAWSDIPNYRESLVCPITHLRNRQRFIAGHIDRIAAIYPGGLRDIYLYDQITPLFHYMHGSFPHASVQGSEYLGYDKMPGQVINGIRHEDATNLSFPDKSLDIIVSTDVLEHVQDVQSAVNEAFRVLRHGGIYLFSVPLRHEKRETTQRARLLPDGSVEHLMMPEKYHPSPVDEKGSLVFYDFGWDILDMFKSAGFNDAYVMAYYDLMYGYIGEGAQIAFCAEK